MGRSILYLVVPLLVSLLMLPTVGNYVYQHKITVMSTNLAQPAIQKAAQTFKEETGTKIELKFIKSTEPELQMEKADVIIFESETQAKKAAKQQIIQPETIRQLYQPVKNSPIKTNLTAAVTRNSGKKQAKKFVEFLASNRGKEIISGE